jgi:hypothetical protein
LKKQLRPTRHFDNVAAPLDASPGAPQCAFEELPAGFDSD